MQRSLVVTIFGLLLAFAAFQAVSLFLLPEFEAGSTEVAPELGTDSPGRSGVPADLEVMSLMDKAAVSYQLILTKTDKLDHDALMAVSEAIAKIAARHGAAHPEFLATSSISG